MTQRKRRIVSLLILALLAVFVVVILQGRASLDAGLLMRSAPGVMEASGVIAAEEIAISSLYGGRVASIAVNEGDVVAVGQELVALDTSLLDGQIEVVRAQVEVAQAALRQIEAGARPGAIAAAKARVAQAKAAYEAALQGLADAQALRDDPQELKMQVAISEIQIDAAQHRLESAVALKDAAEVAKNVMEYSEDQIHNWSYPVPPPKLPQELQLAPYDWWQSWAGVNAASANLEKAKARLSYWRTVLENPVQLEAQVATAKAAVTEAQAAVELAEAQLRAYEAGATEEQLAAARARVEQARAALDALLAQRKQMVIVAPIDGVVLSRAVHVGEVVAPGGNMLSLADLTQVQLTVYVPENRLGEIALNQKVRVSVYAYPGRVFEGQVVRIADQAQFTPRNVASKEERVNTVYAVEIQLSNEEGLLKPGMAADARFEE
nr:efflux RND transporter periplasmic adaptor subunit [Chloroflexota bacterium]